MSDGNSNNMLSQDPVILNDTEELIAFKDVIKEICNKEEQNALQLEERILNRMK